MVSYRCGVMIGKCPFVCSVLESDSRCTKYTDRRDCSRSMQQRKKSAKHSKIISKTRIFDKRYIK